MKRTILCATAGAALAAAACAELTPEQTKSAEALIAQFAAPEFAARQQAVEKLVALGPDVLPLVKKALAEAKDNEVKLRCGMVIRALEKPAVETGALTEEQRLSGDASLVTLDVRDAGFAEVVEALAQQSGNAAFMALEDVEAPAITLKAAKRPYWEVLDQLCDQAAVRYDVNYETHRARFVSQRDPWPRACAGPVNVRVVPPDPQSAPQEKSVLLRLEYLWEDRMPVGGARISVEKAVFADGSQSQDGAHESYWTGSFGSADSTEIRLSYPGRPPERIAELTGTVKLYLASGEAKWTVENALVQDEADRIVDRFLAGPRVSNVHLTEKSVWMTVSCFSADDKPEAMNPPGDRRYRFCLIDPKGNRYPSSGQYVGTNNVTEKLGGLVFVIGDVDDKCICARTVGFPVLAPKEKGWALECVLPSKTIVREYRFTLKDFAVGPQPRPKKEANP